MAYESYGKSKTYHVFRYNRFNWEDENIVISGLTKEQAEKIAAQLRQSHIGLGATEFTVRPD